MNYAFSKCVRIALFTIRMSFFLKLNNKYNSKMFDPKYIFIGNDALVIHQLSTVTKTLI